MFWNWYDSIDWCRELVSYGHLQEGRKQARRAFLLDKDDFCAWREAPLLSSQTERLKKKKKKRVKSGLGFV